jgi:ferrous iron transport protein B
MNTTKKLKIGLVGNPNSGKSSLFNFLTGLKQDVSNFPGVTVDKKTGIYTTADGTEVEVVDLPGTYSLFPNSAEERIVLNILLNEKDPLYPDLIVYVADITQLERHLLFATQIIDLGFPLIMVLNMIDLLSESQTRIDPLPLKNYLHAEVVPISVREQTNVQMLKDLIDAYVVDLPGKHDGVLYEVPADSKEYLSDIQDITNSKNIYIAKILAHHHAWISHLDRDTAETIATVTKQKGFNNIKGQVEEIMSRYQDFSPIVTQTANIPSKVKKTITDHIDHWITHRFFGPVLFFLIMLFIFQSIYTWAVYPMEKIDEGFVYLGQALRGHLPQHWSSELLINGLLPGLAGVLVFIPQITILFFLITILEESGYMSRVVYMFDGLLQKFGMNGRSMVSLISSGACAIPAIMSTRTISNPKERLITILVSPLISCSARLPVYAILIGFIVPSTTVFGVFNSQGLAFMGLYLLGIAGALLSGYFFKQVIKTSSTSFLLMELPDYKPPLWKNVFITVKEKVWAFVFGAGKIIIIISLILWFLASFGPGKNLENAEDRAIKDSESLHLNEQQRNNLISSYKLESSYIGITGKMLEPIISPLGFDWKIGIALITSFAAREVFVGTMATIYSIGSDADEKTIRERMRDEVNPATKEKVYNFATSLSLLVFYVFAMQCMSTLAVTKRETNSWKWPIIQFLFMGVLAYSGAFLVQYFF